MCLLTLGSSFVAESSLAPEADRVCTSLSFSTLGYNNRFQGDMG